MSHPDSFHCTDCGAPLRLTVNLWVNQWFCPECDPFFDDVDEDFHEPPEEFDE